MNEKQNGIDAFRREIDDIDDALLDLLQRRAGLVEKIGSLKARQSQSVFRPAREAMLLRTLLNKSNGKLSARAIVRIWREIIGASIAMQGDLTIACCPFGKNIINEVLVQERFGLSANLLSLADPSEVVHSVACRKAKLGLVPFPNNNLTSPWWMMLKDINDEDVLRVIASVPFLLSGQDSKLDALIISLGEAELSGEDETLLALEFNSDVIIDRAHNAFLSEGLDCVCIDSYKDLDKSGSQSYLFKFSGLIEKNDDRLDRALSEFSLITVWQVGIYATPYILKQ
ncbi:MAG: hypothetical protein CL568_05715 [Alphaproteobacteria bacterium]|nr:hypothetical protein [Alphaproteobacteria bacterium]PPR12784.1 MAG: hypothetical protein CFH42_01759 [Alphaproteobacteria bacterium MarineAlpha12_Bin1]|tara:strand:- start:21527 stop:22381 length:855 start_codon:yes stop_codon:yes gene_type:complete